MPRDDGSEAADLSLPRVPGRDLQRVRRAGRALRPRRGRWTIRGVAPDVHIYTRSKVGWVVLPDGAPAFDEYYDSKDVVAGGPSGAAQGRPAVARLTDVGVTMDEVREVRRDAASRDEAFVRGRVKFRVGRIVFLAFSKDGTVMGFGFPKEWRAALVESEPEKFSLPSESDMRYHWVHARLDALEHEEMRDLVENAWALCVPKRVAEEYAAARGYRSKRAAGVSTAHGRGPSRPLAAGRSGSTGRIPASGRGVAIGAWKRFQDVEGPLQSLLLSTYVLIACCRPCS